MNVYNLGEGLIAVLLGHPKNKLLANRGSLRLEVFCAEFCVGDYAYAQEGDFILMANESSGGYFHILAGRVEGIVEILDALLLTVPGIATGNAAIYCLATSICFRDYMGCLKQALVTGIVYSLGHKGAISGIVGV